MERCKDDHMVSSLVIVLMGPLHDCKVSKCFWKMLQPPTFPCMAAAQLVHTPDSTQSTTMHDSLLQLSIRMMALHLP
jgi:hypothetical protein